jgi:hypothetical protein
MLSLIERTCVGAEISQCLGDSLKSGSRSAALGGGGVGGNFYSENP